MSPIDPQDYNERVQDAQTGQDSNNFLTPEQAVGLATLEMLQTPSEQEFLASIQELKDTDVSSLPAPFQGRLELTLDAVRGLTDARYTSDLPVARIYLIELAQKLGEPAIANFEKQPVLATFLAGFWSRLVNLAGALSTLEGAPYTTTTASAPDFDGDGDPDIAFTPEAPFGEPTNYQEKAREVVRGWLASRDIEPNVYTVWFAKTLRNHKSLISTDELTGYYFEVTYDGDKDKYYLDVYLKQENIVVDAF